MSYNAANGSRHRKSGEMAMRAKSFLKTGIGATLALAIVVSALPAQAQERERGDRRERPDMQAP